MGREARISFIPPNLGSWLASYRRTWTVRIRTLREMLRGASSVGRRWFVFNPPDLLQWRKAFADFSCLQPFRANRPATVHLGARTSAAPRISLLRGWRNTVANLIELLWLKQTYHGLQFTCICVNNRGYSFIEFETSNNTISTVFRQPLKRASPRQKRLRDLMDGLDPDESFQMDAPGGMMALQEPGVRSEKVQHGVSTNGVLPLTYFYVPKSDRAYLSSKSVKIHYFCSGPISVDPICPQPREARPSGRAASSGFRGSRVPSSSPASAFSRGGGGVGSTAYLSNSVCFRAGSMLTGTTHFRPAIFH